MGKIPIFHFVLYLRPLQPWRWLLPQCMVGQSGFDEFLAGSAFVAGHETIDKLRARYGRKVVYFGSVQDSSETAPMRISFTHILDLELDLD